MPGLPALPGIQDHTLKRTLAARHPGGGGERGKKAGQKHYLPTNLFVFFTLKAGRSGSHLRSSSRALREPAPSGYGEKKGQKRREERSQKKESRACFNRGEWERTINKSNSTRKKPAQRGRKMGYGDPHALDWREKNGGADAVKSLTLPNTCGDKTSSIGKCPSG